MEFILTLVGGALIGFVIAAIIGRSKFAVVQDRARRLEQEIEDLYDDFFTEKDLNDGLIQELDAAATGGARTRNSNVKVV